MISIAAFIALFLYEIVSFPLYVRIIFVLFTKAEFKNNPFYRLICFNGILDVCHCCLTITFYRLPMFMPTVDLFPTTGQSRLISAIIVCYFSLIYQICFLHVVISFNRLSAIFFPFRHIKLWKTLWPAMPIAGFILSICLTFHRVFSTGHYISINATSVYDCGLTPVIASYDFYQINQNLLTAIVGSVSLLLCMLCNGLTLAKILQRKRASKQLKPKQQPNFKNEIHLFIVSIWMMFFMCIFIIFEIAMWGSSSGWLSAIFPEFKNVSCFLLSQIPWVEDLFSLSQPWVLILANRAICSAALPFTKNNQSSGIVAKSNKSQQRQPQQAQQMMAITTVVAAASMKNRINYHQPQQSMKTKSLPIIKIHPSLSKSM